MCEGGEYNFEGPSLAVQTRAFQAAVRDLPAYPPRTSEPTPRSAAFEALHAALAEAPESGSEGPNLVIYEDCWPRLGEMHSYWSHDYITRIYQALIDIINAHGVGDDGWRAARWIVYDKVGDLDSVPLDLT